MKLKTFIIKGLSKAYKMIFNPTYYDCMKDCKSERQECNDVIFNALENGKFSCPIIAYLIVFTIIMIIGTIFYLRDKKETVN